MSTVLKDTRPQWLKLAQPFAIGGLAGSLATCVIQPIDMIKVRIQLVGETAGASKSPFVIGAGIVHNGGFRALYKGLDAAILRQLTYTTTRIGVFRYTSEYMKATEPAGGALPFYKKAFAGLFAGGIGAFIGTPADLSLVRMQADTMLPAEQRRNYRGVFDAFRSIVKSEGVTGLWKGSMPTVTRAMALNLGMLATFDQAKEYFSKSLGTTGFTTAVAASALSGFMASSMSLPFDFVKTRIQKQKPDPLTGLMPHKSNLDCAMQVLKKEGPGAFYAGFPTYFMRIAPHAMLVLLMADFFDAEIKKIFLK
jgi:solute carrier family 25 oxoglutarate transporter 11